MHCLLIALDHIPYHILTDVTSKVRFLFAQKIIVQDVSIIRQILSSIICATKHL